MKIVLELHDETLHGLVEAQVGKAVAKYTESVIQNLVAEIVKVKLDRFDNASLPAVMENAAKTLLLSGLGKNDWTRSAQLKGILADAAVRVIRDAR